MVITKRLNIRRWKKGILKEDTISILLLIFYVISLFFIWALPIYIKLIYVNPVSIPIETVIGWFITLIAIVPTLTLTAAQLASGAYTYKIVSLYKNDLYFWIQLGIFLLIILMGISLKIFEISDPRMILTFHSTALFGTLFLVPYFLHTLTSIGFEANVNRLINQVKRKTLLPLLFENKTSLNPNIRDPSFDVRAILEKAIKDNDLQAFGFVLNRFTSAYEEFLQELIEEPIMFHPKFGHTVWDGILGQNESKKLWTGSAIRKLAEQWFYHIPAIQKSTSKNEYMMIELASIINNFSIECYTHLLLLNDKTIEDVFGQKIRYLLTTMAIEGIKTKQLDSVDQCVSALADQGCYGAKNNVGNAMVDITFSSKKDLEKVRKHFEKLNGWTNSDCRFILGRLLNANRRILITQLNFQKWNISFDESIEISRIIFILELEYDNVRDNLEDILIPILLQYYGEGKEEKLREVAKVVHEILPLNQETILQSFNVMLDCYQKSGQRPSHSYRQKTPKDWLSSMINNLYSLLTTPGLKRQHKEILGIFEDLAIVAFRMQDYNQVQDLLKRYFMANLLISKSKVDSLYEPYNLPICIIYSCLLNKKDDLAKDLIQEMLSFGNISSEAASKLTYHFTYLGSFAEGLGRDQVADFIIDQLIKLEESYPNKLESLKISAELSGYTITNYSYVTPQVGYSDEGYFNEDLEREDIRKLLKLNEIENPDKKCASQFMRKLASQFLILAYKRSILLKNITS